MFSTLRTVGVVLVATLAFAILGSSTAVATTAFTSESSTTSVEGDASKVTTNTNAATGVSTDLGGISHDA